MEAGNAIKRDPVSLSILSFAQKLAERADGLASRTHAKLGPVMVPVPPQTESINKAAAGVQSYPPLFDELRDKFGIIDRSLNSIEDALSRTEL